MLDESTSAVSRARRSAEKRAKLEKRKKDIKKALRSRLIVEEKKHEDEGGCATKNCDCERCQY